MAQRSLGATRVRGPGPRAAAAEPPLLRAAKSNKRPRQGCSSSHGTSPTLAAALCPWPRKDGSSRATSRSTLARASSNGRRGSMDKDELDPEEQLARLTAEPRVIKLEPSTVLKEVQDHIDNTTEPHFTAPLGIRRHLPLFIFLPGLDGTGMYISSQLEGLEPLYDVRCLCIPVSDRSTYLDLANFTAEFIAKERVARGRGALGCPGGAPVTVAGESFGGPVALTLAAKHPDAVQVLVVINSGSGLRRHPLLFYGSYLIPVVPTSLYDVSAYCITPFLSDLRRLEKENQPLMMPPMSVKIVPKDTVNHRVRLMADFEMKDDEIASITADTLCIASVRDRLLPSLSESRRLTSLINKCQMHLVPDASHTVLLEADTNLVEILAEKNLLPPEDGYPLTRSVYGMGRTSLDQAKLAAAEAREIGAMSINTQLTADAAIKATRAIRENPDNFEAFEEASLAVRRLVSLAQETEETSPAARTETLSLQQMMAGLAQAELQISEGHRRKQEKEEQRLLKKAESEKKKERLSKFKGDTIEELTGAAAGAAIDRMMEEIPQMRAWNWVTRPEFLGLENIPRDERPILFVGNHTIYGLFDMPLMIYEVRKQTGLALRGLAHPLHYMSAFGDLLARYGAVKATPKNCYRLLQSGQAVLLYPGGAREVAKRKGEKYKLMWKDDAEFVRLAMRFQCTIVPFASVGTEEAFNITMDSEEIIKSPLGPGIERMLERAGLSGEDLPISPADVIPPISTGFAGIPFVPSPKRLYFKFCPPITTDHYAKDDINDKEKCQELYNQVRSTVEDTIDELHEVRDRDPLKGVLPRSILSTFELWDGS